ncbi:ectin-like [Actinia tenebrosa]|uniref:Ectin-like n=1 Tax=Actinia tenebrosa TaxID=6105 RepID=A0A6P8I9P0_ACTTE|nr:ectin-like [Actinia tenebrosa]XP_031564748.1 ectin-like [Actinia tenebrosa]
MILIGVVLVMVFEYTEGSVYANYGYGQRYPSYPWSYQTPYQFNDQPRPLPPQRPIITPQRPVIPGSPQWKRLQFIKKYQAFQRSRTGGIEFGPKSKEILWFEKEALTHHNSHRHLHQVDGLTLDHDLSRQAAQFARSLADSMKIEHSNVIQRLNQHENIAVGCRVAGPGLTALEAVKYWYQTICYHNWVQSQPNAKARPFTNMIWKSSNKFGIGFARFKTNDGFNCSVIVARYSPSNGQNSDFSSNVNKGLFEPVSCQYVNNRDKPDFIEPDEKDCKVSNDHHGQIVNQDASCTFSQLFSAFGASRRRGKLSFRVVL